VDGARRAVFSRGGEGDIDRDGCDRIDGIVEWMYRSDDYPLEVGYPCSTCTTQMFVEIAKERDRDTG
jgi:hypothetical protein